MDHLRDRFAADVTRHWRGCTDRGGPTDALLDDLVAHAREAAPEVEVVTCGISGITVEPPPYQPARELTGHAEKDQAAPRRPAARRRTAPRKETP
ncbi:MAG TPA: hypothetical protein VGS19_23835 [Streptosporangiaceae bacterium]|nr:hypothetical protein [Streptosporangiaceae bacterium]